ncbi:phosphoric diester hydrolase-like protein [Thermochaetoides thermophila DSM 1495]|uniref:Phosphoric diester hydrolase-like protein n=1 Tax=Chaetomium thermophilum (strain DSM 1495 / CBS 144.50 / IMI 039719) TaxID=759272 RepID=G0SDH5_CHATD|nr:phosphoric diester hydrolase-like protein [Thermochaetoides thermophila DSM 1495]EGS18576.1 phosphoric diester hydrolase-like protein [Thermochaetoides thermophila DSM 1495]
MASLKRITTLLWAVWLLFLFVGPVWGQKGGDDDDDDDDDKSTSPSVIFLTGTRTTPLTNIPSGIYKTYTSQITLASTSLGTDLGALTANITDDDEATTSRTRTTLTGSVATTTGTANNNGTSTSTSTATPTNTRPCNNYPELCARKYSNITQVGTHNSPFVRSGSAAANQQFDVIAQLDDGVRFLQAQIQWPTNGSVPHFCHTSCDLLDAGPITDWLRTVAEWVAEHPYDVVTILLGNGNYSNPDLYVPYIEESGITRFVYTPHVVPLRRDDWPTLGQMILSGQRVVMFLDYVANQTAYPWLIDQFSHMWETPFDPTDPTFPCIVHRPPDLPPDAARDRLYLMNHNLNVEVSLLGQTVLVPAVSKLNETNAVEGEGSLGSAAQNCTRDWGRPPNVLNVDYYNFGNYPGSVFEVAAKMNNVTWVRKRCCGSEKSGVGRLEERLAAVVIGLVFGFWMALS